MSYLLKKYEFNTKGTAQKYLKRIKYLNNKTEEGELIPTGNHVIDLGYITLERGEFDADGKEIKAPTKSVGYCLDVVYNCKKVEVTPGEYDNNGETIKEPIMGVGHIEDDIFVKYPLIEIEKYEVVPEDPKHNIA